MKTAFILLFLMVSISALAQKPKKQFTDDIYFNAETEKQKTALTTMQVNQNLEYEFNWLKRGLNDYHRQQNVTFWLGVSAVVVTSVAIYTDDTTLKNAAIYGGAALSVGSLASWFIQQKKLKRACNPVYP